MTVLLALVLTGTGDLKQTVSEDPGKGALRLRLQLGQQFSYRTVTSTSMSIARGEGSEPIELSTKQQQSILLDVEAKTDKGYKIQTTVRESKSAITQGQGAGASMEEADKSAVGKTTVATYDSRGTMIGALRGVQSGQKSNDGSIGNMGFFSTGFLGLIYPKGEVKKGTSWTSSVDMGKALGKALGGMRAANKSGRIPIRFTILRLETSEKGVLAHIGFSMNGQVEFAPVASRGIIESGPLAIVRSNGKAVVPLTSGIPVRCDLAAKTEFRTSDGTSTQRVTVAMKRL